MPVLATEFRYFSRADCGMLVTAAPGHVLGVDLYVMPSSQGNLLAENVPSIGFRGELLSACELLRLGYILGHSPAPRAEHRDVVIAVRSARLRDQAPLHAANIELSAGFVEAQSGTHVGLAHARTRLTSATSGHESKQSGASCLSGGGARGEQFGPHCCVGI